MAQKNVLQFIILGLLNEQPLTGYELTKAFDSDIGEFWSAKHSQIYPLLNRMEGEQLITHETEVTGEKLERKRYALTSAGAEMLTAWLNEPTQTITPGKDEFALKLYFISDASDERLHVMLQTQLQLHRSKLEHLEGQMKSKFSTDSQIRGHYGHYLILNHAIRRETEYCRWLEDALASAPAVADVSADAVVGADSGADTSVEWS